MELITTNYVRKIITPRPMDMHKGQAGRLLFIAGSKGMAGAAVLAARGALYSGAGLVKVSVPDELFNILQISVTEAMCITREEAAKADLNIYDAICIGPGLGTGQDAAALLERVIHDFTGPLVIDADGINCLCKYGGFGEVKGRSGATVFTPHPGEADRMLKALGYGAYRNLGREETVRTLALSTRSIVVLKGAQTLIADGTVNTTRAKDAVEVANADATGANVTGANAADANATGVNAASNISASDLPLYENPTGNPGMATGGSGDVLSGMITSLLGQKTLGIEEKTSSMADSMAGVSACVSRPSPSTIDKVCAAVFLHGLAGDIAAQNIGEYGMTAADIADAVAGAFQAIND